MLSSANPMRNQTPGGRAPPEQCGIPWAIPNCSGGSNGINSGAAIGGEDVAKAISSTCKQVVGGWGQRERSVVGPGEGDEVSITQQRMGTKAKKTAPPREDRNYLYEQATSERDGAR